MDSDYNHRRLGFPGARKGPTPPPPTPLRGHEKLWGPEVHRIISRLRLERWCRRKRSYPLARQSYATALDRIRTVTQTKNYHRYRGSVSDEMIQEELDLLQRTMDTRHQKDLQVWQQQRAQHTALCDQLTRHGYQPCQALFCHPRLWVQSQPPSSPIDAVPPIGAKGAKSSGLKLPPFTFVLAIVLTARTCDQLMTNAPLLCPDCVDRGVSHRCRQCAAPAPPVTGRTDDDNDDNDDGGDNTRCRRCETVLCLVCQSTDDYEDDGVRICDGCEGSLCDSHFSDKCDNCTACHKPCVYCRAKDCCDCCASLVHSTEQTGYDEADDDGELVCNGCKWQAACDNCGATEVLCDVCAICQRTACGSCLDNDQHERLLEMTCCLRCSAAVCGRLPHGRHCRVPHNEGVLCPPCADAVRDDLHQAIATTDVPSVSGIVRLIVDYSLGRCPPSTLPPKAVKNKGTA